MSLVLVKDDVMSMDVEVAVVVSLDPDEVDIFEEDLVSKDGLEMLEHYFSSSVVSGILLIVAGLALVRSQWFCFNILVHLAGELHLERH